MPDESSPKPTERKESPLENLHKKRRDKKKRQKQRRAKASEEATAKAYKETQSEQHAEVFQNVKLIDIPLCNYFKTYEIDVQIYIDTSILFDDKKSIMIDKIIKDIK